MQQRSGEAREPVVGVVACDMLALLLFLACGEPDPDATGPRWDTATPASTTTPTAIVDTAPTPLPTGSTASTADTGPDLCTGFGPAQIEVGQGSLATFVPFADSDRIELTEGPYGDLGFTLDLLSNGLDTRSEMNAVLRLTVDGEPADFVSLIILNCPTSGPGWGEVHAALSGDLAARAASGDLAGVPLTLTLSVVDTERDEATVSLALVVD